MIGPKGMEFDNDDVLDDDDDEDLRNDPISKMNMRVSGATIPQQNDLSDRQLIKWSM